MTIDNVGDLKRAIKDLPDDMDVQAYDVKKGRYVTFQLDVVEEEHCLDIEVNILEEEQ